MLTTLGIHLCYDSHLLSYSTSRPDKLLLPEPLLKATQPLSLLNI